MTQASHQTVRLSQGKHRGPDHGACVMELASMLAGEPFSDRPRCVDPVIAGFLRTYNDGIDESRRQDLYPLASEVVGSRAVAGVQASLDPDNSIQETGNQTINVLDYGDRG